MYYNIKIKSKDSEFTLDSNNKAVIQREMDIYFAHIFNASEEFKSKIKKVEITNENVKSIIEVEEPQSKPIEAKEAPVNNLQEIKFSNTQENIQTSTKEQNIPSNIQVQNAETTTNTIEQKTKLQESQNKTLEDSLTSSITNIIKESVDELPKEELKPKEENKTIEVEAILPKENTNSPATLESETKEEFETLPPDVTIHPDELLKFQQSQEETSTIEEFAQFKQTTEDESIGLIFQDIKEVAQTNNDTSEQDEIDEIINMAKTELNALDISKNREFNKEIVNIVAPEKIEENTQQYLNNLYTQQTSNAPIGLDTNNYSQLNMQNVSHIDFDTIDVTNLEIQTKYANMQVDKLKNEAFNIKTQDTEENKGHKNQEQQSIDALQELDLSTFLKSLHNVNLITDEFIICAFYMKNFLGEEFFTMKQINSKLFQATGKIASTSVADELINKGYLKSINEVDSKKYCITEEGEKHFAMTYQG